MHGQQNIKKKIPSVNFVFCPEVEKYVNSYSCHPGCNAVSQVGVTVPEGRTSSRTASYL